MALTAEQARNAKAKAKAHELPDGGGLHLFVTPNGGRYWRLRYEFDGKEKTLSMGPYPAVRLVEAREQRDAAKYETGWRWKWVDRFLPRDLVSAP